MKTFTCLLYSLLLFFFSPTNGSNIQTKLLFTVNQGQNGAPLLGQIVDAEFDSNGNLYLSDQSKKQIHIYDLSGEYITSIGREGRGPGEFSAFSQDGLAYDKHEQKICAIDYRGARINCFSTTGHHLIETINLQSSSTIRTNGLISFNSDLFILGSHQSVNSFIHKIDSDGITINSIGDFIEFENFIHNHVAKMQLSQVVASSFNGLFLVSLSAPNITKVFDNDLVIVHQHEDDLLPTPWETHMEIAPNRYSSTFYSMAVDNQILSNKHYLYAWSEVIDPEIPEIEFHIQLRGLQSGEILAEKSMGKDFILGMKRTSDSSALMLVRTDENEYEVQKIVIH
jgi:hypothetical protein